MSFDSLQCIILSHTPTGMIIYGLGGGLEKIEKNKIRRPFSWKKIIQTKITMLSSCDSLQCIILSHALTGTTVNDLGAGGNREKQNSKALLQEKKLERLSTCLCAISTGGLNKFISEFSSGPHPRSLMVDRYDYSTLKKNNLRSMRT